MSGVLESIWIPGSNPERCMSTTAPWLNNAPPPPGAALVVAAVEAAWAPEAANPPDPTASAARTHKTGRRDRRTELPLKSWRLLHGGRAVLQGQVLAGRVIDLVAGELLAEDDFLTARAGAAGTEALAGPVAVGAPLLAEIATLALTAGVDGAVAA